MTHREALLIMSARLLGASWRRIAELFGGATQADGMRFVDQAESTLGLPAGLGEDEELYQRFQVLLDEVVR
ncbi:MAG: hypothetical protein KGS10_05595 [Chloroflexi bacterium]|nr:hypothetical protein [Chloroflexota bacterium]